MPSALGGFMQRPGRTKAFGVAAVNLQTERYVSVTPRRLFPRLGQGSGAKVVRIRRMR
jgi:hypothetical protein